jgi:hypothetical protein
MTGTLFHGSMSDAAPLKKLASSTKQKTRKSPISCMPAAPVYSPSR